MKKSETSIIAKYIKDGYYIDWDKIKNDPEKLNKLAAEIRELRTEYQNIYYCVREYFKVFDFEMSLEEKITFNFIYSFKLSFAMLHIDENNKKYKEKLLLDQFLLFLESSALMAKKMTMQQILSHFDKLIEFNGYR